MRILKLNKIITTILLLLFAIFMTLFINDNYVVMKAASTVKIAPSEEPPEDPEDLQNALDTAPRGLDISDPTFQQGVFTKVGSTENMNASKVIKRNDSDPTDNTRILRVTHRYYQLGSIWSNIDQSNYLDVSKDQTMSMWLYFGRPPKSDGKVDKSKEVGDGMAFVLQNAQDDPENINNPFGGIRAISRFNGNPIPGQTLGVWGADVENDLFHKFSTDKILPTAIQNSFAIEFDTFLNKLFRNESISGEGVSFDYRMPRLFGVNILPINGQHINMDYPDMDETYFPLDSNSGTNIKYYYMMKHNHIVDGLNLTNSKWHHMTVKFNHSNSVLSYTFDDKNIDGTAIPNPINKSIQLNMDHFKLNGSNKLRWGFTGSTGKYMENNLIVFESIPTFVSADSTVSIKDNTKNKTLTATDKHVDSGDDLSFIYNLNYKNGSKDWSNILAQIKLPEQVTFTSGTVTYNDGSSENISLNEYTNNQVRHILGKSLSNNMDHAQIELHTSVKLVKSQTKVQSTHVKFESDNFIIDDDNQDFIIDLPNMMIDAKSSITIDGSQIEQVPKEIPISGNVWYTNGNTIHPNDVTLHASMGKYTKEFQLSKNIGAKANFDFKIPKAELIKGQNILIIYATDNKGHQTGKVQILFKVSGNLEFGDFQKDISFQNIKSIQSNEIIPRQDGWKVEVIDGRGSGRGWVLQAKATDLFNITNGKKLDGGIIYRSINGKAYSLNDLQSIYWNIKDDDEIQTVDVASKWTKDSGVLLQLGKANSAGLYSGKIDWSLVDGISNN